MGKTISITAKNNPGLLKVMAEQAHQVATAHARRELVVEETIRLYVVADPEGSSLDVALIFIQGDDVEVCKAKAKQLAQEAGKLPPVSYEISELNFVEPVTPADVDGLGLCLDLVYTG